MVKERPLTNHVTEFEKKPIEDDFNDIAKEEEEDPKGPKWKTLFYDFTQNTSMHGISYVTSASRFMARRIAWLLLVATCAGVFIYYAYNRLDYYLQFTKNVNVEVNYLQKIKFPAVTFCNQNAFKITPVANNGWYDMMSSVFNSGGSSTGYRPCLNTEFQCDSKDCIPASARCDLFPDCPDASDEYNCKPCPVIYFMGPASAEAILPDIVGERFRLQPMTYESPEPLYMNTDTPTNIYLYHDSGQWIIGEMYGDNPDKLAYVTSSAATPQEITGNWYLKQLDNSYAVEPAMNLSCGVENLHYLDWETSGNFSMLNLSYIYETASHDKSDFIVSCHWKGEVCQEGSIKSVLTDMGICYTFYDENNFYIEQAGPGYGLSLKINIEKYEYTKSVEDGIGIKLLMHELGEVPPVAELGTSVSPGLYSFISVETTQVKNLEPPWGTCGESELKYYDTYSIPNCKMDCETKWLDKECGCRDLYMPEESGNPPVCDVGTYVSCAEPELVQMRAAGNHCTCATPCKVETYVPTTSFSVVLGPETDTGVVDNETLTLLNRLKTARETTFRVVQSRYTSTLRMFHVFSEQLSQMVRFASSIDLNLKAEAESVAGTSSNVFGDCIKVRDIISGIRNEVINFLSQPFDEFQEAYISSVYQPTQEFINLVKESRANYPSMNGADQTELRDYLTKTLLRLWSSIKEGVDILNEEYFWEIYTPMDGMALDSDYTVDATRFAYLEPYLDEDCGWCVGTSDPLAKTAYDLIRNYMSGSARTQMTSLWNKVDSFYKDHVLTNNDFLTYTDFTNDAYEFGNESNSIRNKADQIRDDMRGKEDDIVECLQFLQEMEYLSWRLQCQTEFKKLSIEYEGSENQVDKHLAEFVDYMAFQEDTLYTAADRYISGNMTLEEVAKSFDFDRIITATEQFKTRVETELNNMILKLENLHKKINTIYFVFMTELKNSYLTANSDYWGQFSISSPSVSIQSTAIGTNNIPNPELTMVANPSAQAYWTDLTDNVNDIKSKLSSQVSSLLDAIDEVKAYFDAYVVGNTLNSDFYGENFLQVELFYKELTERKVSQQKAYDYQNLLSELGGLMGLLLGASCMTLVEIFDLFLYNSCRKCIPPRKKKTMVQPLNTT